METNKNYIIDYSNGFEKPLLKPINKLVRNMYLNEGDEAEANLLSAIGEVAEKNGVSVNEINHLFPAILRMLKSDCSWAK